ncbi:aromatic amino acid ammonia-lyase [Pseudonocardia sp. HH130630-07]|uniref:aromatic amino acid ammonia-lyase n=1 Tax=Pseudonocardia sp. HH130630-07 TaxID=1690815 RepID=UPI000814BC18|nr:aromatic amino acid ammonia-lyase [Pseudonocardia sp. HH130630-07]ANY09357.1 histidine ammonia-lyase [Pseudonocardia sp. HH130630-07]
MSGVVVDGESLSCRDVVEVAPGGVPVTLSGPALAAATEVHRTALAASAVRPVYGRTTGVGANRDAVVGTGDAETHDLRLLLSHAAGVGDPLDATVARASMLVRLNQLAAAGSGIHPRFLRALETALRNGAVPRVHDAGSIGTGDLSVLAEIGLTLTGHLPWARGTAAPIPLEPGDALAFMSSNAVTLARAVLVHDELTRLLDAAHVVAALSYCALGGASEAFAEQVHARRPHPGTVDSAARMRRLLWHEGDLSPGRRIQDPFGLRAFCQVHGPALDGAEHLRSVLEIEINAAAENPLIDAGSGAVFHHGQFSTAYPALALDNLRAAVHHVAELSAARLGDLVEPEFTGLAAFLASGPPGSSGVMILEYVAHDSLGRLRHSAGPVTLGTSVISRGVEDHASFTPHAARSAVAAAAGYRTVLACELVAAVRALRLDDTRPRGYRLGRVFDELTAALPDTRTDHQLGAEIAGAAELLDGLGRWGRDAR